MTLDTSLPALIGLSIINKCPYSFSEIKVLFLKLLIVLSKGFC